jgi:transcriptional regulator with XRE-family HTH domain
LSQTDLAKASGITFQQVQKYEKGTNRVSASRLFEFATLLGVEISYFFDGADETGQARVQPTDEAAAFQVSPVDVEILRALWRVKDSKVKRRLLDIITSLPSGDVDLSTARLA